MKKRSFLKPLFLFFTALLLVACSKNEEKEVEIPAGIMSEDSFAKVLTDFALAESAANLNVKNVVGQKIDSTYAFDPLKENKISQGKYDSTVSFYVSQPKLYKKVYENVLVRLSEMQANRNDTLKGSGLK